MKSHEFMLFLALMVLLNLFQSTSAFVGAGPTKSMVPGVTRFDAATFTTSTTSLWVRRTARKITENEVQNKKISNERRRKLGIADDEDEYDLDVALDNSTDPFITKVIAGSLILTILALLVAGIIVPATTDYGEGVCNTLLTGGRC